MNDNVVMDYFFFQEFADLVERNVFTVSQPQLASTQRCEVSFLLETKSNQNVSNFQEDFSSKSIPKFETTKVLERNTRFFPIFDKDSVLFAGKK
jgi:hypothetical protein